MIIRRVLIKFSRGEQRPRLWKAPLYANDAVRVQP